LEGDYSCSIEWRNGTSFGFNDLEALLTVARKAKKWMVAHAGARWHASARSQFQFATEYPEKLLQRREGREMGAAF
jgi:hypothetical protein